MFLILGFTFMGGMKSVEVKDLQLYNQLSYTTDMDTDIQQRVQEAFTNVEETQDLTGVQGTGSTDAEAVNAIASDEDAQKVANWFNTKASGPCVGQGQYLVAQLKKNNLPIYYAVIFPGIESSYGKQVPAGSNNFGGLGGASNMKTYKTPEACSDAIVQSICNYRDKMGADPKKVTSIGAIYYSGKTYENGGKSGGDNYADAVWPLVQECAKATGVAPDVSKGKN